MAVWAIGDIQGCYDALQRLLEKIEFNLLEDELWIAGDLVNRGDKSLEVLNYFYSIKESVRVVLGNHDVALIATYAGIRQPNPTILPILEAPNVDELMDWLRHQPFLHWDYRLGYAMAHAGISPQFDFGMAIQYASQIEKRLRGENYRDWLMEIQKKRQNRFDSKAHTLDMEKYILSSFINMRFCKDDGKLNFKQKGKPTEYKVFKKGLKPWFACPSRKPIPMKIIFGHWSTLGYYQDHVFNVLGLDTGCVWGRKLTACRLDIGDPIFAQVKCDVKSFV